MSIFRFRGKKNQDNLTTEPPEGSPVVFFKKHKIRGLFQKKKKETESSLSPLISGGEQTDTAPSTFRVLLGLLNPRNLKQIPGKLKEKLKQVREAYAKRNEEGKGSEKVKYPAALFVASVGSYLGTAPGVLLVSLLHGLSEPVKATAGAILGSYTGSLLSFSSAWYVFNKKRFGKEGLNSFLRSVGEVVVLNLCGVAVELNKKLNKESEEKMSVSKRLAHFAKRIAYTIGGLALSPMPLSYEISGPLIALFTSLGVDKVAAASAGWFTSSLVFIAYSTWMRLKTLSKAKDEP